MTWDAVEYELASKSAMKGSVTLDRHGEELAEFVVRGFKNEVTITVADGVAPPAGLLLFCAWIAQVKIRDRAAAAS